MPLIQQEPIYLSVHQFKQLTKLSWLKISDLTDIPERTLYRYQQAQKSTQHRKQIQRLLGLTYKLMIIEKTFYNAQ